MKERVELASSDSTKASAAVAVVACTQPATDKAKNRGNNRALRWLMRWRDGGQDAAGQPVSFFHSTSSSLPPSFPPSLTYSSSGLPLSGINISGDGRGYGRGGTLVQERLYLGKGARGGGLDRELH